MKPLRNILTILLVTATMSLLAQPVLAARLASVKGQASSVETQDSADFRLGDQSAVTVQYDTQKTGDGCSIQINVYREQNGRWLVVNTILRSSSSKDGSRTLNLPAGNYQIKVNAKHARYDVSVDN